MGNTPIVLDSSAEWFNYASGMDNDQDLYARFIITYIATLRFCHEHELFSEDSEIDVSKFENYFIEKYSSLPENSRSRKAIKDWKMYFGAPGIGPLKYPSGYPSKERTRELKYSKKWKDIGNAIFYVIKVRNNLVHGGKTLARDSSVRDYKVVELGLNIMDAFADDLYSAESFNLKP